MFPSSFQGQRSKFGASKCHFMERVQIANLRSHSSYLQPHLLANHPTIFRWLVHTQSSRFAMMMLGMQKTEFWRQCMHLSKPKQTTITNSTSPIAGSQNIQGWIPHFHWRLTSCSPPPSFSTCLNPMWCFSRLIHGNPHRFYTHHIPATNTCPGFCIPHLWEEC